MAEGGLPFKKHAAKSRKASTKILKDLVTKMQAEAPPLHAIRWPPRGKRPGTALRKSSKFRFIFISYHNAHQRFFGTRAAVTEKTTGVSECKTTAKILAGSKTLQRTLDRNQPLVSNTCKLGNHA